MSAPENARALRAEASRLARGEHGDPFAVLGRHWVAELNCWQVRVFAPEAEAVEAAHAGGNLAAVPLGEGLFCAEGVPPQYRLRVHGPRGATEAEDPYRFGLAISAEDAAELKLGRCWRAHHLLGAHAATLEGAAGLRFAVWAPNARRVSVAGSWNGWSGLRHPMRFRHEIGVWEIFLPGLEPGVDYVFEVRTGARETLRRRDPYARAVSTVARGAAQVRAAAPAPPGGPAPSGAASVLALDAAEWARDGAFKEAKACGFGAVLLRDGAGAAPFAPAAAAGAHAGARFAAAARRAGLRPLAELAVAGPPADWARFDGEALYENGRRWQYARFEVANLLFCAALSLLEEAGFGGLLLRGAAEALWPQGGRLDQAALDFCGALSELLRARAPEAVLLADELGEWPAASWPTAEHGLALDAARAEQWADCLAQGAARASGLVALGLGPQVRAFGDWRRSEARPDWARAKLAALTALAAPGWALFERRDLDDPFPGAAQDRPGLAAWRAFLGAAHRMAAGEPAFAARARLRLLAQPAGAAGPIVFSREAPAQAAVVALAPQAGYSGPIPAPFRGEFRIVLRSLAGGAGGAKSALPDLGSPSGFSLEIDMAQNEGLVVLGRRA